MGKSDTRFWAQGHWPRYFMFRDKCVNLTSDSGLRAIVFHVQSLVGKFHVQWLVGIFDTRFWASGKVISCSVAAG